MQLFFADRFAAAADQRQLLLDGFFGDRLEKISARMEGLGFQRVLGMGGHKDDLQSGQ